MKTPIVGLVLAAAAAAQTYPVAGVVRDGVHNTPVERARVILAPEGATARSSSPAPMASSLSGFLKGHTRCPRSSTDGACSTGLRPRPKALHLP